MTKYEKILWLICYESNLIRSNSSLTSSERATNSAELATCEVEELREVKKQFDNLSTKYIINNTLAYRTSKILDEIFEEE